MHSIVLTNTDGEVMADRSKKSHRNFRQLASAVLGERILSIIDAVDESSADVDAHIKEAERRAELNREFIRNGRRTKKRNF